MPMPPPVAVHAPPPRRVSRGPVIAIVVLAMLVAALGGVVVTRELDAPTDVTLEPVATAGANPFMESVGTDVPDVRPVADTGGSWSGTTPGLYGGSGSDAVCDRSQLSRFLGENPDRAAGWASVLGLPDASASTISLYVDGLTSVVLRSDTYVTNHGWSGGSVTSWPAVLQAGTAVLVDRYGNPVTRCACGNPLTAPQSFDTVAYVGPRWYSFTSSSVTMITQQTTQVTDDFTIVDVRTGRGQDRPRGSDGEQDTENPDVQAAFPRDGNANAGVGGGRGEPEEPTGGDTSRQAGERDPGAGGSADDPVVPDGSTPIAGAGPTGDTTGGTAGDTAGPTSSTTTPPSSTTTATTSSASGPAGDYTSSGCGFASGTLTFSTGGTYSSDAGDTGRWAMRGADLVVTPGTGSPVTFTGSTSAWTSAFDSCSLTAAAS